ncbi:MULTISPECIES: hypothetical protein [unclassified Methylobacterium]|uniref:hypothetical protein n=1 Tax=unclassified Methylobacterium TaxID=2615210 RepID=UPI00226A6BA4|nr:MULTISPECIES: hypothetical protein [unclassified Methylobacterium]
MATSLIAPAAQVRTSALGCGVIHAAAIPRVRAAMAIVTRVLLGASPAGAPDDAMRLDDITTDNGA